jgi:hypothetical protein
MPSKGQRSVKARLPEALYDALMQHISRHNLRDDVPCWNISDAVVAAIIELVHHAGRGRGVRAPRPTSPSPDPGEKRRLEEGGTDDR